MRVPQKWKKFEHLVAALHRVEMKGADVKWNDNIDGRQLDVTVRFENGPYKYLTVIECKDYASAVEIEKIESLVTKAKKVGADKAVMFSSHGFQSGAVKAAMEDGVSLFSLEQTTEIPDDFLAPQKVEYVQFFEVILIKPDGTKFVLPEDPMKLHYYVTETVIEGSAGSVPLHKVITSYENQLSGVGVDDVVHYNVDLIPASRVTFPNMERDAPILVRSVQWKMANRVARPLKRRTGLDPALFIMPYQIKDELTGEVRYVEGNALAAAGELTAVRPGCFYHLQKVGLYYCEKIENDIATMILLECYQHGTFVQVVFRLKMDNVRGYTQVTEDKDLERLRWRLREFHKTPFAS